MRTAFEEDEDEIPHHGDDREVTLSPTTVLLIFFGLVLVCGLCFGLGYSLGHRSTPEGAESAPIQQTPLVASTSSQPKPSAAAVTPAPVSDTPASSASDSSGSSSPSSNDTESSNAHQTAVPPKPAPKPTPDAKPMTVSQTQIKPALTQPASNQTAQALPNLTAQATPLPTRPAAATSGTPPVTQPAPPSGSGAIMVQVAAISNPTDAQVLVGALRRHGYSASVRNQPTDSLLHVQVGPFATRAEAFAMKQKLLSDGYNAILK